MSIVPPQPPSVNTPAPYYSDDRITLYHGDALTVLPEIKSAGCMVLDPPYHMAPSTFRGKDDGAASSIATPVRLLTETFRHAYRILPDGGAAFIFCDWRRGPDTTYLATLAGLRISTCLAWTRNRSGTGGMFRGAWDPIYVASKGAPSIRDRGAIPNVVNADHPTDKEHPYEKPAKVWDHLLSRIPPTTVVDAFAGSSTSADMAVRHGHRWIGIEADERHCEAAARRWGQDTLFGGAHTCQACLLEPAGQSGLCGRCLQIETTHPPFMSGGVKAGQAESPGGTDAVPDEAKGHPPCATAPLKPRCPYGQAAACVAEGSLCTAPACSKGGRP